MYIQFNYYYRINSLQISKMQNNESYPTIKDFVLQQANEKSFQTMVLGLKDYEKQKSRILQQKKQLLHSQFQKRNKQNLASKRIHRSSLINGSRMKKMQSRHHYILDILKLTEIQLANDIVKNQSKYKALLKNLIIEGLIRLLQPKIYVRCLKRDQKLVQSLLGQCKKAFQQLIQKDEIDSSLGQIDLQVDSRYFLQVRQINRGTAIQSQKIQQTNKCFGGVVLTNEDGLIVCTNTIDSRLELAYQHLLPDVRRYLFN